MIPANAIRQHRVLEVRLAQAKTMANHSHFNTIEDNGAEIGIIGSGVGYYYARSVLDTKKFSWLKLGFVHPFPQEIVRRFALKVKKIIVIEDLRPYLEENIQRLGIPFAGKNELGLEEIGELTPDNVRVALANYGLTQHAPEPPRPELPQRPPAFAPDAPTAPSTTR
jgi:indolepyruvate ferredoxin oxidoreductase alpha subunit